MDRYVLHGTFFAVAASEPPWSASNAANMADTVEMSETADSTPPASAAPILPEEQYSCLAQAVTALLSPTITTAVDRAIAADITQLRKELGYHAKFLSELEHCIFDLEDEIQSSHATEQQSRYTQQYILDKLDDLENRLHRNNFNLRVIELPESLNSDSLYHTHPGSSGISTPCIVKRDHRLGAPSNDRHSACPIIVCYLNFSDRVYILRLFWKSKSLQLNGHKLLMFADYTQEVLCRCKAFQPICTALYQKDIKFTLAFPAVLCFTD